jgi:hypothetical protein
LSATSQVDGRRVVPHDEAASVEFSAGLGRERLFR